MYYQTGTLQWAKAVIDDMLATLTALTAAPLLTTPTVVLFSGATVPGPESLVADFTPCVFSGYADQAITLSAPVNLTPDIQALIGSVNFIGSGGPFTTDVATGYIITDGATAYYGGERFPNPIPFSAAGDFLNLDVKLPALTSVVTV